MNKESSSVVVMNLTSGVRHHIHCVQLSYVLRHLVVCVSKRHNEGYDGLTSKVL